MAIPKVVSTKSYLCACPMLACLICDRNERVSQPTCLCDFFPEDIDIENTEIEKGVHPTSVSIRDDNLRESVSINPRSTGTIQENTIETGYRLTPKVDNTLNGTERYGKKCGCPSRVCN